jgi:hypothetical protein
MFTGTHCWVMLGSFWPCLANRCLALVLQRCIDTVDPLRQCFEEHHCSRDGAKFNRTCSNKCNNRLKPALSSRFALADCAMYRLKNTDRFFTHLVAMVVAKWWKMWYTSCMVCTCSMKLATCPLRIFTTPVIRKHNLSLAATAVPPICSMQVLWPGIARSIKLSVDA